MYRRTCVLDTGHDPKLTTMSPVSTTNIAYYDYIFVL